ncbi:MAG: oligosaccharide flippase family protein [Epsilonproteobacteria bacterium]|nr:oligosaccharide flippase family protein [Campylobacterota bacterium]
MIHKKLISNFSYLLILEIANYIIPFVAMTYIIRIIGVDNYGLINFSYVVISYFGLFIDYGFKMIIIKDISFYRNSTQKVSLLFSKMYISKLLLFVVASGIFAILLLYPKFYIHKEVFIFSYLMIFAQMFFPTWFFQAIEKMKFIVIFDVSIRILYLVAIFTYIKAPQDYVYIPLLNAIAIFIVAIGANIFIWHKYNLRFILPKTRSIVRFFKRILSFYLKY